ncbi:hypothetical protein HOLleu_30732 [Holothuria leucospilota]|uniref:Uncharacterized protein n=1 Tax=Holothuria leucospilota TaxID=206669 RepID=A0A9Q1GZA2_HOLLE|nr:hypothetical protein HOLleu_30732 [Holothuria leucospilota]
MGSSIENEQLPGTSPPPLSTSVGDVASEKCPPYSPPSPNQPVYTVSFHNSVPQEVNQPPVLVRYVQFYEPDPPGLRRTIAYSLVLSSILLICVIPVFCAVPALIYASMTETKEGIFWKQNLKYYTRLFHSLLNFSLSRPFPGITMSVRESPMPTSR